MNYTYKLNSEKFMDIPQRHIFVQEFIDGELFSTWSIEEIQSRWRWPWDQRIEQTSFMRCKEWLKENHQEMLI